MAIGESLLLSFHPMYPLTNDPHTNNHRASVCDASLGNTLMKNPFKSAASRIEEEKIYAAIALEIAEGSVRAGLWTKAVSEAGGNEPQIQSNYIKLRFQNILDEMALQEEEERLKEEEERLKEEEEKRKANSEALKAAVRKEAQNPPDPSFLIFVASIFVGLIVLLGLYLFLGFIG